MPTTIPPPIVAETGSTQQSSERAAASIDDLLRRTQEFAEEIAHRPNRGPESAPLAEIARLGELGVQRASLPCALGGLGLGLEPGTQRPLLRLLAALGGADLALGRIVEGHINALLLLHCFASAEQRSVAAADCIEGRLFGVWNTGMPTLTRIEPQADGTFRLLGSKTFATGVGFVQRPLVTAELAGAGWQMSLPRMEECIVTVDRSFWHPLGMESTGSYAVDFTGSVLRSSDLIGKGGDFYRDPLFRGGAVRFAAVQAGAVLRLHGLLAAWLNERKRGDDPYQIARLGEVALLAQQAVLWVERSADVAEACLFHNDDVSSQRMVECANMTRLAVERIASQVMQLVTISVGAHGLLQPLPFERILRNLTMYLRQPAPDQALRSVGLDSLCRAANDDRNLSDGFWSSSACNPSGADTLPPAYFEQIYGASADPWNFETSPYESEKYTATVTSLPRNCYASALEIGCSIGVLTARLAQHAGALIAIDVSEAALARARARCAELPHVSFARMQFPEQKPRGSFELIIVSEVAYYWSNATLDHAMTTIAALQSSGGHLVLVHWTPVVLDYPLTGDEVHNRWLSRPEWRAVRSERTEQFRLDVLERLPRDAAPDPQAPN